MVWLVVPLLVDVVSATCRTIEVPACAVAVSVVPVVQLAMVSPPAKMREASGKDFFQNLLLMGITMHHHPVGIPYESLEGLCDFALNADRYASGNFQGVPPVCQATSSQQVEGFEPFGVGDALFVEVVGHVAVVGAV